MAQNDGKTAAGVNGVQAAAEKTQAGSERNEGRLTTRINADILKANIRAARDAGDIPGVRILESERNDKTSIICGKNNVFIEGKRVTILVIEE